MRTLLLGLLVLSLVFTLAVGAFTPTVSAGDGMSVEYSDPCEPDGLAAERPGSASTNDDPGPPNCLH